MDADRFDHLARALGAPASRRAALKGLDSSTLAALAAALSVSDAGAMHHNCRHVGKSCSRDRQCCSSRCRGPKGNETCQAHHEGSCTVAKDYCRTLSAGCGGDTCVCYRTTGGANYCAYNIVPKCMACTRDRECELVTGPGSACIDYNHSTYCAECSGFATACVPPCTA